MGKLIVWNLMSLEGYFEGPAMWDLNFHGSVWSEDLEALSAEHTATSVALVFGRVTYEGMEAYWTSGAENGPLADAMNSLPKYVASTTLKSTTWNNSHILAAPLGESIARLKREHDGNLFVFGSAKLIHALRPLDLIDEYRIGIAPLFLGAGTPLFKPDAPPRELKLIEARTLKRDCVLMRYARA